MTFKEEIRILFDGYISNDNFDLKKFVLLKRGFPENKIPELYRVFYDKYNFRGGENYEIGSPIFEELPFENNFSKDNFWLKENNPIIQLSNDQVLAYKDGVREVFYKGEFIEGGEIYDDFVIQKDPLKRTDNEKNQAYEFINVLFDNKKRRSSNNFFIMFSGKTVSQMRNLPGIRIYLNLKKNDLKTSELKTLIETKIIKFLNDRLIPFQLKIPYSYQNFNRRDNCVLYLSQTHFWLIKDQLKILSQPEFFETDLPLFVGQLYPGIGIAEDPICPSEFTNGKESFGENRINILLSVIYKNIELGKNSYSLDELETDLNKLKYNVTEFYRNPSSSFKYDFEIPENINLNDTVSIIFERKQYFNLNNAALNIGLKLIQKAYYDSENNSISWVTYRENGTYTYLNENEKNEVLTFLKCISKIEQNQKYLPSILLSLIQNNITLDEKYFENWKNKSLNGENSNQDKNSFKKLYEIFLDSGEGNFQKLQNLSLKIKNYFAEDPTEIEKAFKLYKKKFESKEVNDFVWQIYNSYSKSNYPMKNQWGTNDFDVLSLTHIGLIYLFTYCPKIFPKK